MTERLQRSKFLLASLNLVKDRPFLLESAHPFINVDVYLNSFHRGNNYQPFGTYTFPWGYRLEMIDQYKDKLINFCHLISNDNPVVYALFQLSKEFHFIVYFRYAPTTEEYLCFTHILAINPKDVKTFLDENEKHIELENPNSLSFGFNTTQQTQ